MEHLNHPEIEELKSALQTLTVELNQAIEHSAEETKPVDLNSPIGRLTRMDAIQQQSMAKANLATNKRRLEAAGRALKALESGEYGICTLCGEDIPITRLRARPESQLCISCKGAHESRIS